jgi:redox-sensitive bicupin YhaK (pirin superfamily)
MASSVSGSAAILKREPMSFPMKTLDPFLFAVFHDDKYPAGSSSSMAAPIRGDGSDFELSTKKPFRMYHGETIPGFPQHPHRGLETITVTLEGLVDHADSLGAGGRYGQGDCQHMCAGSGIQHQEMFPLIKQQAPNTLKLYQLWLNLPAKAKLCPPDMLMHWAENVQRVGGENGGFALCYVGELAGAKGGATPASSWASDPEHHVGVYFISLPPGGSFTLPPVPNVKPGVTVNRMAYVTIGAVDGVVAPHTTLTLDSTQPFPVRNSGTEAAEVLILQGVPIGEPVVSHGPFVVSSSAVRLCLFCPSDLSSDLSPKSHTQTRQMNTRAEIAQAFADFQRTGFGGWPWPEEEVVFPREQGRFVQRSIGGKIVRELPPSGERAPEL